jgi:hypothetical protein
MKLGVILGILAFGMLFGGAYYTPPPDSVTFLGGSEGDHALDVAVDSSGCIYVVGYTWNPPGVASDFPVTPNAWDTSFDDLVCDAFTARLLPRQTKKKTVFR